MTKVKAIEGLLLSITKIIEWDMGHRVPNHQNKCKNPHGHRYRLEASFHGQVNTKRDAADEGMICDFFDLKSILTARIHDTLDHKFMVYEGDDKLLQAFQAVEGFEIVVVPFIPTVENIVVWCRDELQRVLPLGLRLSKLRLYETPNCWADLDLNSTQI